MTLGIWGAKPNFFQGAEDFISGIWGDLCIIFREQVNTDPAGGLNYMPEVYN